MTTEGVQRKMAAILCADVEGYTRLMQDDPEATLLTLKEYRAVFKHCSESLNGRIIDSPGDNILIEFPMTVDAVQCAVEIQRKLIEKNTELSENRRMQFRIGIDSGDLLQEDGSLYGDGVNISARLQSLAESSGICISGRAHDQVVNRLPLKFEFLGKRSVKNIAHPIRVYRVLIQPDAASAAIKEKKAGFGTLQKASLFVAIIIILGVVAIWHFRFRQAPTPTEVEEAPRTIAVLPFEKLSSDPEQEYFVDGLTEELLNSLAKIPDLLVTARTSSFTFKDSEKTVQEIADVLGVAHILEGSVRKAGNALRITVQLIRASDGFHLWSETYNRELEDIFEVQEDIATTVANELKLTLGIDSSFKQLGGTDNVEAYEFYLAAKGLLESLSLDVEDMSHSIASVDAAIEIDPNFAMAWALKAKINGISLAAFGPIENSAAEQEEGVRAALKAIELEPNLAAGYISLGGIRACTNDWIGAQLAYSKAIEFSTESTDENLPAFNINVGHFKRAKEILESTRKSDPLNELNRMRYILTFGFLGDYKRVDEEYQHFASLLEDTMGPIGLMNIWLLGLGVYDSSVRDGMEWTHPISDVAKEYLQSPEEGIAELRRIYTGNEILSVSENLYISLWAAYFGDPEFAMDALEKGIGIHSCGLFVIWYPAMREVRQLPRFKEFIREIGLIDYWNEFGWPDICHKLDNGDFVCD